MPLTSLLLTALALNRRVEENDVGVAIRLDKMDNEIFLLFSSDKSDNFHKIYLRDAQDMTNEPSCCDAICFAQVIEKQNPKIIICFIELKGGKNQNSIPQAVKQIIRTYEGVKKGIEKHQIDTQRITWKALIVAKSSSSPQNIDRDLKILKDKFGNKNVQYTRQNEVINVVNFIKENKIVSIS